MKHKRPTRDRICFPFAEILKLAKGESESQLSKLTQAEQDTYEMQVRAANMGKILRLSALKSTWCHVIDLHLQSAPVNRWWNSSQTSSSTWYWTISIPSTRPSPQIRRFSDRPRLTVIKSWWIWEKRLLQIYTISRKTITRASSNELNKYAAPELLRFICLKMIEKINIRYNKNM